MKSALADFDYGVSMAPLILRAGPPGNVEYFEKFKAELESRIASGTPELAPKEKYRILWGGWASWAYLGFCSRLLTSYGAVAITGRYSFEMFPQPHDMLANESPLRCLARQFIAGLPVNVYPVNARRITARLIEDYSIDGIILYQSRTCRLWNLGQPQMLREMEREFGVPGVIVDDDNCDSSFHLEAQIATKLQTLFEMIEERCRGRMQ